MVALAVRVRIVIASVLRRKHSEAVVALVHHLLRGLVFVAFSAGSAIQDLLPFLLSGLPLSCLSCLHVEYLGTKRLENIRVEHLWEIETLSTLCSSA